MRKIIKLKKIICLVLCMSLTGTNLTLVQAKENGDVLKDISSDSITLNDGSIKEIATYTENGVSMKMETVMKDGMLSELFIYADEKMVEHQIYNNEMSMQKLDFNPKMRGSYDYLTFTPYRQVDSWSGNTQLDNLTSTAVISVLINITGHLIGAGKLATYANIIIAYYINRGYHTGSKVNMNYKATKYWSNSTNTNTDYVFRTKFVYKY